MSRASLGAVLAAAVLAGCVGGGDGGSAATATPLAAVGEASPSPSPTSAGSPSPTATATGPASPSPGVTSTPTASPSPTADETAAAPPDRDAALAAAAERRRSRPGCDRGGIVDDVDAVVAEQGAVLLVYAACFVGAYQANGELLAYDGRLREWPVEQWIGGAVVEQTEVVGEVVAAPDGLLENLQLYRGLGDCGVLQRWEVRGERLVLVEAREQTCDDGGQPPVAVVDWPLVYEP